MSLDIFQKVHNLIQTKERGVLGTIISSDIRDLSCGSKFLLNGKGILLSGEIPDDLLSLLQDPVQEVLLTRKAKTYPLDISSKSLLNPRLQIFLDPIVPTHRLIILGGGHIAVPLVQMGKLLGFEVTVVDDRPSFANKGRFPEADSILCQDFQKALQELEVNDNTYVIIVTRGHRHDQTCLEEVLKKPRAAYLGMIGSRRKVATLMNNLQEQGYSPEVLNHVYTPIGLDIGAQSPEEIAVSIMAEIIMVNHYGFSQGLRYQRAEKPKGGCTYGPSSH